MRRILLSFILICVLTVPVLAHPGGTDSSGGHYDHSTGEYHYHHGYGPHDHEDLDGDGDLDCPYDFEDKTGESSGDSSGSSTRYPAYTRPVLPPVATQPAPTVPAVAEPEQKGVLAATWEVVKVIGIMIVAFVIGVPVMVVMLSPYALIQFVFFWLRERFGKQHKEPEWKPAPQRIPGKRPEQASIKAIPSPEPPPKQLSIFEEVKSERTGDPNKLIWKSAYAEMEYTRITDHYIHIKDLERVAGYFAVDTETALQLLNDDRIHSGMPPMEVLKV